MPKPYPFENVDFGELAPRATRIRQPAPVPKRDAWGGVFETVGTVVKTAADIYLNTKKAAQLRTLNAQETAFKYASLGFTPPPSVEGNLPPEDKPHYQEMAQEMGERKTKPEAVTKETYKIVDPGTKVPHLITKFFDKQGNFVRQEDHGVAYEAPQRPYGVTPAQKADDDRLEANTAYQSMQTNIYDWDAMGKPTLKPNAAQIIEETLQLYSHNQFFRRLAMPLLNEVRRKAAKKETPEERAARIAAGG